MVSSPCAPLTARHKPFAPPAPWACEGRAPAALLTAAAQQGQRRATESIQNSRGSRGVNSCQASFYGVQVWPPRM